jgi:hypothetical protein
LKVWLKFLLSPRVCRTGTFIHSPVRVRTQSDELRLITASPQQAQN